MTISTINRWFIHHPVWGKAFLVVVFVLPLVFLFGYADTAGCRPQQRVGFTAVVGRLGSQQVSRETFFHHLQGLQMRFFMDYQRSFDASRRDVMQALAEHVFNRIRVLDEAKRLGVDAVSETELKAYVSAHRAFQRPEKGGFDSRLFANYRDSFLYYNKIRGAEFDQLLRENIVVDRMEKRVMSGLTVPGVEALIDYLRTGSRCDAYLRRFNGDDFLEQVEVSDEEAESYYNEHAEEYRAPEARRLLVAAFTASDFLPGSDIDADRVQTYYDENRDTEFKKDQVRLRTILVQVALPDSEEVKEQKRNLAENIRKEATADGADFATVAEQWSDDAMSKANGGDLGYREPSFMEKALADVAFELEVGAVSEVIETRRGFQIIRVEDRRSVLPLEEVEALIRQTLASMDIYERDAQTKYSAEEVRARQILVATSADDTPEVLAEKRQRAMGLLAQARAEGADFGALAEAHSDDPSKAKGGDLGYIASDRMPKAFADAVNALETGGVSDVVTTPSGFHVIKKEDVRRRTRTFPEVKNQILIQMRQQQSAQAKDLAAKKASEFADMVYQKVDKVDVAAAKIKIFRALCETELRPERVIESDWFSGEDTTVPGVPGTTTNLAISGMLLGPDANIVSDVVEGEDYYYVACWLESRSAFQPPFRETADDGTESLSKQAAKAKLDLRKEHAVEQARETARAYHEELAAKLIDDANIDDIAGADETLEPVEFALASGPQGDDAEAIRNAAEETPSGTLAAAIETEAGMVVLYVKAHRFPDLANYEANRGFSMAFYIRGREQAEVQAYYDNLAAASAIELNKDWAFLEQEPAAESVPN